MTTDEFKILVLRMDERTQSMQKELKDLKEFLESAKSDFVTKDEFSPVKAVVFGTVSLILTSVLSGLIYLAVK